MQPLITVIVPVYKVEDYLPRCLDSLCRQSLKDIEILLIDDASPDRCGKICDAYAAKDKRFKVYHNEKNRGLSVARNIGIEHASADYLMFVDSDDYVHEDFCKTPYECAVQQQADLVLFGYQRIKKSEQFAKKNSPANNSINTLTSGYKTRMETIDSMQNCIGPMAWNKLYHKKLFRNVSYPPGCFYEDWGTTYKTAWQASCIYFLNKILYYWYYRTDSITTLKTEKAFHDRFEMILQQHHDLQKWGFPPEKLRGYLKNHALTYCIKKKRDNSKHYAFWENVLLDSKGIPENFSGKRKILFVLFKYCRPVFELICNMFNKKVC